MSVALVGIAVTTLSLIFALIAFVDGVRAAIFVVTFTAVVVGVLLAAAAFWLWVGGVLA